MEVYDDVHTFESRTMSEIKYLVSLGNPCSRVSIPTCLLQMRDFVLELRVHLLLAFVARVSRGEPLRERQDCACGGRNASSYCTSRNKRYAS